MKRMSFLALAILLAIHLISCNNDSDTPPDNPEEEEYPIKLLFDGKEIVEFKLFIGSPEGGIEASTENMTPADFWGDKLIYYPEAITFNDDETATLTPNTVDNDTFAYRFEEDSLFRFNPYIEKWFLSGIGDKNSLNYNIGYFIYGYRHPEIGGIMVSVKHDNGFASESGINWDEFSLENLRQPTDSLLFCNINYIYKKVSADAD